MSCTASLAPIGVQAVADEVGGRDLGDYVSSPDDYVGLVAEHFASAWALRDVVSSLVSIRRGHGAGPCDTHEQDDTDGRG